MTDAERLDWMERNGGMLVTDYNDNWAVAMGSALLARGDAVEIKTAVDNADWRPSLRGAIDAAMADYSEE